MVVGEIGSGERPPPLPTSNKFGDYVRLAAALLAETERDRGLAVQNQAKLINEETLCRQKAEELKREIKPLLDHSMLINMNQETLVRANIEHIGRNDPCPCGSGKKYKNCCVSEK